MITNAGDMKDSFGLFESINSKQILDLLYYTFGK